MFPHFHPCLPDTAKIGQGPVSRSEIFRQNWMQNCWRKILMMWTCQLFTQRWTKASDEKNRKTEVTSWEYTGNWRSLGKGRRTEKNLMYIMKLYWIICICNEYGSLCIYMYIYIYSTPGVNVEAYWYLLRGQCWCLGWLNIGIRNVDV